MELVTVFYFIFIINIIQGRFDPEIFCYLFLFFSSFFGLVILMLQ